CDMSACSICLEPELREPAACIPCGHTFCHACISQWIQSRSTLGLHFGPKKCPQCRVSIGGVQKLYLSDQPMGESLRRDWSELSESSRFWVFAVGLLIFAFVVQDIQQENGVYGCVISPMLHVLFDIVQQIVGTAAFLVFRCVMVLVNCSLEVAFGLFEIAYAIVEMFALVLFDIACVPWVLLVACIQLISALVSGLFGFIQRVVTSCLICLSVCFLVSMLHEEWKTVFRDLALTTVDWVLRQLPESGAEGRERTAAGSHMEREAWQQRLAELLRAAMVVIQRELRQRGEATVDQAGDTR
ncbi:hypothetical protein BaRGS_00010279, partial [Batillaria attramentaria]